MSVPPAADLAPLPDRVRRAMRLSVVEGAFFALMVGFGETYFVADAFRLGGSPLELGLVVTLPLFLGGLGPLAVLRALGRAVHRRRLVVAGAVLQAVALLGLSLADARGAGAPRLVIAAACLYQVGGQAAGTAWSSWFGDLVPKAVRGRYFAGRTRAVHLATCVGLLAAGSLLHRLEPAPPAGLAGVTEVVGGTGFSTIFAVAAGFRLVSALLLVATLEPRFGGLPERGGVLRFLRTGRGSAAWRLLGLGASLQLLVCVASPYFTPYMLEELRFSYVDYTIAAVALVVVKVALLPVWGRAIDQFGARSIYPLAAVLVSLVPIPWLFVRGLGGVVAGQAFSGLSWGAHEVSYFTLLLDSTYRRTRPVVFAAQSLTTGGMQLLGSLVGGLLASASGDLRVVFAASIAGRLLVALAVPYLLPPPRAGVPALGRRAVLMRVIGFRPNGGLVHRPIEDEAADGAAAETSSEKAPSPAGGGR